MGLVYLLGMPCLAHAFMRTALTALEVHPLLTQVRATGDQRGRGAFAVVDIPSGTMLGWYEGELLSERQYWQRYPSGTVSGPICLPPFGSCSFYFHAE